MVPPDSRRDVPDHGRVNHIRLLTILAAGVCCWPPAVRPPTTSSRRHQCRPDASRRHSPAAAPATPAASVSLDPGVVFQPMTDFQTSDAYAVTGRHRNIEWSRRGRLQGLRGRRFLRPPAGPQLALAGRSHLAAGRGRPRARVRRAAERRRARVAMPICWATSRRAPRRPTSTAAIRPTPATSSCARLAARPWQRLPVSDEIKYALIDGMAALDGSVAMYRHARRPGRNRNHLAEHRRHQLVSAGRSGWHRPHRLRRRALGRADRLRVGLRRAAWRRSPRRRHIQRRWLYPPGRAGCAGWRHHRMPSRPAIRSWASATIAHDIATATGMILASSDGRTWSQGSAVDGTFDGGFPAHVFAVPSGYASSRLRHCGRGQHAPDGPPMALERRPGMAPGGSIGKRIHPIRWSRDGLRWSRRHRRARRPRIPIEGYGTPGGAIEAWLVPAAAFAE